MDALYVCLFSNGHIKVGRSIEARARIAAHVDRVACMGVELVDHHIAECRGPSEPREAHLIARCVASASKRFKNEWFEGLDFPAVCEWAREAAELQQVGATESRWTRLLRELKHAGMTQMQIAAHCNCGQSTISELASGRSTDPLYSLGERLIALHAAKAVQSRGGDVYPSGSFDSLNSHGTQFCPGEVLNATQTIGERL